jgi:hypothetical protein
LITITTKHLEFSDDAWQSLASGADILVNIVKTISATLRRKVIIKKGSTAYGQRRCACFKQTFRAQDIGMFLRLILGSVVPAIRLDS